jgi:trehalose 6-phosphate phosphatase
MTTTAPPSPSPDGCLFLDVDGTLLEFTDSPFDPQAGDALKGLLAAVSRRLDGAVALVSGRSIRTLDDLFAPLRLPAAGLHGIERRSFSGATHGMSPPGARLDRLDPARTVLGRLVDNHPGTLLEDKDRTIAVHFRRAPAAEPAVRRAVVAIAGELGSDYEIQAGDKVLEIKPRGADKGGAVAAFLAEAPFHGRRPVYVGDDLTDLSGFRVAAAHGGLAVAVGDRVVGTHRLENPAAVRAWLGRLAAP